MNLNTLNEFRHAIYDCFGSAKDALFNTVDALLSEDRARSFIELSLSPLFERRWPSLYEGLEDGTIDQPGLRHVFARFLPEPMRQQTLWIGTDVSGIARPRSRTSPDRSAQHVHNLPECKKPVTYGWQFSTVVALPSTSSSWVYALTQQRVTTETTAAQVALEQMKQVLPLLPKDTISVFDRGYDATWFWCQCSALPHKGSLIRLKRNRCLYRAAPRLRANEEGHAKMARNCALMLRAPTRTRMDNGKAPMSGNARCACSGGNICMSKMRAGWT
jgi:hypothetical protein